LDRVFGGGKEKLLLFYIVSTVCGTQGPVGNGGGGAGERGGPWMGEAKSTHAPERQEREAIENQKMGFKVRVLGKDTGDIPH